MLPESLYPYEYRWPLADLDEDPRWEAHDDVYVRSMPETPDELARDSRWPAFFPAPLCLVTTSDGDSIALEREVGASIVNRFPYVVALSFCREALSSRHHVRRNFMEILERGECVALQYVPPGDELDRVLAAIEAVTDENATQRIGSTGMPIRKAITNDAPVFEAAYMVYEATLVRPGRDFEGAPIYEESWVDVGSHRIYFLEINAIQLREDIAHGETQISWRSLPLWEPETRVGGAPAATTRADFGDKYTKGYTPHYRFPAAYTTAFEYDSVENGMAVKHLPPLPEDQVEVDNDRARWPCFFPSPVGMITTWAGEGVPNLMPCGSTTILSRSPFTVAIAVSYAEINVRYAPRASLDIIRRTGRFGCGVPFIDDAVLEGLKHAGNISLKEDPNKIANAGLLVEAADWAPRLAALPIHFDCEVIREVRLGTHILFLAAVKRIVVRRDVSSRNPLHWCPWAGVVPVGSE